MVFSIHFLDGGIGAVEQLDDSQRVVGKAREGELQTAEVFFAIYFQSLFEGGRHMSVDILKGS